MAASASLVRSAVPDSTVRKSPDETPTPEQWASLLIEVENVA